MTPDAFLNAFFGDGNEIDRATVDRTPTCENSPSR